MRTLAVTTASFGVAASEIVRGDDTHGAAVAATFPLQVLRAVPPCDRSGRLNYRQRAESLRCEIQDWLPLITTLDHKRRPAAVLRLVVAIGIDAVQRVAIWARSHIGVEHFKRCSPTVANRDAAPAIETVVGGARNVAPRQHSTVRAVFARVLAATTLAVLVIAGGGVLSMEASASFGVADCQVRPEYGALVATDTSAFPQRHFLFTVQPIAAERNHSQAPNDFASAVSQYSHKGDFTTNTPVRYLEGV